MSDTDPWGPPTDDGADVFYGDGSDYTPPEDWDSWLNGVTDPSTNGTGLPDDPSGELMDQIKNDPGFQDWLNNMGKDQDPSFWDNLLKGAGGFGSKLVNQTLPGLANKFVDKFTDPNSLMQMYQARASQKNNEALFNKQMDFAREMAYLQNPWISQYKETVPMLRNMWDTRESNPAYQAQQQGINNIANLANLWSK